MAMQLGALYKPPSFLPLQFSNGASGGFFVLWPRIVAVAHLWLGIFLIVKERKKKEDYTLEYNSDSNFYQPQFCNCHFLGHNLVTATFFSHKFYIPTLCMGK